MSNKTLVITSGVSIQANAYNNNIVIESVSLPSTLKFIGYRAFYNCTKLISIVIPDSVTALAVLGIGEVFKNCSSLTSIKLSNNLKFISKHSFHNCGNLTSIQIPGLVTTIGSGAFYGCRKLTSIQIPPSVTSISDNTTFNRLSSLKLNVRLGNHNTSVINSLLLTPEEVNNIDFYLYQAVLYFTTIPTLTSKITLYGLNALKMYDNVFYIKTPDVYSIAKTNDDVTDSVVAGYFNKLTKVKLSAGLTSLGVSAFKDCISLTSVIFNASIYELLDEVFYGCSSLNNIILPDTIVNMGNRLFYGCTSLTTISIPDLVTVIKDGIFYGCTSLTTISIPDSVTDIKDNAFYGCTSLTTISIPDSVTAIGDNAFYNCTSLEMIYIDIIKFTPSELERIGFTDYQINNIFDTPYINLTFKETLTSNLLNNYNLFNGINFIRMGLSNLYMSEFKNVGLMYRYADEANNQIYSLIEDVKIPDSVNSIGNNTFKGCNFLTSITIPDSVTSIGDNAFYNCTSLTSITIPDSTTSIGDNAFYNCTSLSPITIPDSTTSIGNNAFYGCTSLTSITIPDSTTSIGNNAFYNCTSLTSIHKNNISNLSIFDSTGLDNYLLDKISLNYSSIILTFSEDLSDSQIKIFGLTFKRSMTNYKIAYSYLCNISEIMSLSTMDFFNPEVYNTFRLKIINAKLSQSFKKISSFMFIGCAGLQSMIIPDSITIICSNSFQNCIGLTSITIPNSVNYIETDAFNNCTGLRSIKLPKNKLSTSLLTRCGFSINQINYNIDYQCPISLWVSPSNSNMFNSITAYGLNFVRSLVEPLLFHSEQDSIYEIHGQLPTNLSSKVIKISISEPIHTIGENVFSNISSLTSISIPSSVYNIGPNAFKNCINLENINFENDIFSKQELLNLGFNYSQIDKLSKVPITLTVDNIQLKDSFFLFKNTFQQLGYLEFKRDDFDPEIYYCTNSNITELYKTDPAAFMPIESRIKSIKIPQTIKRLDSNGLFNSFSNLKNITLYDSTNIFLNASLPSSGLTQSQINNIDYQAHSINLTFSVDLIYNTYLMFNNLSFTRLNNRRLYFKLSGTNVNTLKINKSDNETHTLLLNNIIKITLGDGFNNIGTGAFSGLSNLTEITISNSITNIESNAFSGCNSLSLINISSYGFNNYDIQNSGLSVLQRAKLYSTYYPVVIMYNIKYIKPAMYTRLELFEGAWFNLKDDLDNGIYTSDLDLTKIPINTSFDKLATQFTLLAETVIISNKIKAIDSYAFFNCDGLIMITIPDSVTSIGGSAFGSSGINSIEIPWSLKFIGQNVFRECSQLKSVSYRAPNDILGFLIYGPNTQIGIGQFESCTALTSINIPDWILYIGDRAFNNCKSLTSVTLPQGLTYLGHQAFNGCTNLRDVKILSNNFTFGGNEIFKNCISLKEVKIPKTLGEVMGHSVFEGCSGLLEADILTDQIQPRTFKNCTGLNIVRLNPLASFNFDGVVWPSGPIGREEFKAIISVNSDWSFWPSGYIGYEAFNGCTGLIGVKNLLTITDIGYGAFENCSRLTEFPSAQYLLKIGERAFKNCTNLQIVNIDGKVKEIGKFAYENCTNLLRINIIEKDDEVYSHWYPEKNDMQVEDKYVIYHNSNLSIIGEGAFRSCSSLTYMTFPGSLHTIQKYAFKDCSNLTSYTLKPNRISTVQKITHDRREWYDKALDSIDIKDIALDLCANLLATALTKANPAYNNQAGTVVLLVADYAGAAMDGEIDTQEIIELSLKTAAAAVDLFIDTVVPFNSIGLTVPLNVGAFVEGAITLVNNVIGIIDGFSDRTSKGPILYADDAANDIELLGRKMMPKLSNILDGAFENCVNLRSIDLSPNMAKIYPNCFNNCVSLRSIGNKFVIDQLGYTHLNTLFFICENSFRGCPIFAMPLTSCTFIRLEKCAVQGNVLMEGFIVPERCQFDETEYAFEGCIRLKSITLNNKIKYFGDSMFKNCISLTSIIVPNSVTSIGDSCFYGCSSLTFIDIPNSVTSIGDSVFKGCGSLMTILFSGSLNSIGNSCFVGCSSLEYIPVVPNQLVDSEFLGCSKLVSITIPSSVTSIGDNVFSFCSSLISIKIPNSVTSIGDVVFFGCSSLTSITIPDLVTVIKDGVFFGCSSLTEIVIPNLVTSIGNSCFIKCSSLTSMIIPDLVTVIKDGVFYGCSSLTEIVIPSSVTSIGNQVYRDCRSLKSIPLLPKNIGPNEFDSCNSLISITIPSSVTSIGDSAFSYCNSLNSIIIPSSVTSIGDSVFSYCNSLNSIIIPSSVTSIGNQVYKGCSSLKSIPLLPKIIGPNEFFSCISLTSIIIPLSVTSIADSVFFGCISLTSITIPFSVTSIGNMAFAGCTNLTSATFSPALIAIGDGAFAGCSNLRSSNPLLVHSIGLGAYLNCSNLTSVNIPSSVTAIGLEAFKGCSKLTTLTVNPPTRSITIVNKKQYLVSTLISAFPLARHLYIIGITPVELRNYKSMYTPSMLKDAGYTKSQAASVGYTPTEILMAYGYF